MSRPDIHVFRSAPQFATQNADGTENPQGTIADRSRDSINLRVIDTHVYLAINLSIADARALIADIQAAIDKRN